MAEVYVVIDDPYFQNTIRGIFTDEKTAALVSAHEGGSIQPILIDDLSIIHFVKEKEFKRLEREEKQRIKQEADQAAKQARILESEQARKERIRSNPVTVNMWRKSNRLPAIEGEVGNVVINQV